MWDGENKKLARSIALDFKSKSRYGGIFLPGGGDGKCVVQALSQSTIKLDKPLYFVEWNKKRANDIERWVADSEFCPKPYLFHGDISRLKLHHQIDLAYIDLMGSMNEDLFNWCKYVLVPNLAPEFRISFLFTLAWRPRVPFLERKLKEYENDGSLFEVSFEHNCKQRYQIATYLGLLHELFGGVKCRLVNTGKSPFYLYNDHINPVVLYTLQTSLTNLGSRSIVAQAPEIECRSNLDSLIERYLVAVRDPSSLPTLRRALATYCQRKQRETGTPALRFRAAVKMRLTKMGYDTSIL